MRTSVVGRFDTSTLRGRIRAEALAQRKVALWHDLKDKTVAMVVCTVYALVLTTLHARIIVNILARHLALLAEDEEAVGGTNGFTTPAAASHATELPIACQTEALSLINGTVKGAGFEALADLVESKTQAAIAAFEPTDTVRGGEVVDRVLAPVRSAVEGGGDDPAAALVPCSMASIPAWADLSGDALPLSTVETIQAEFKDILASAAFDVVLRQGVDVAFAELAAAIAQRLGPEANLPMAKVLPQLDNVAAAVGGDVDGAGDALLRAVNSVGCLEEFSFMVFAPQAAAAGAGG